MVNEFAVMFNNTTTNPVNMTLSDIGLGNSLTWDASGANPATPTDSSGNWSSTNANWTSGAGGAIGASDSVWSPGYNAVIGANNGTAGLITITDPSVTVGNIIFNAAGSGNYNIVSNTLVLTGAPTITVASGVTATNSAQLGGTGFTKAGNGEFVLLPSVAATNVGTATVNAGTLFMASTAVNSLNDNVTVNSGATLLVPSSVGMNPASTLTISGGTVTNLGLNGTSTETHNLVVFDNNGTLAYGPAGSAQLNVTNFISHGLEAFPKFPATFTNNFSVKSTAGAMAIQNRVNNSGAGGQGVTLTVLAGTMILDYPNPPPNGDSTAGGQKLDQLTPLTLGGGTLFGRFNAAASRTEAISSTIIQPGGSDILADQQCRQRQWWLLDYPERVEPECRWHGRFLRRWLRDRCKNPHHHLRQCQWHPGRLGYVCGRRLGGGHADCTAGGDELSGEHRPDHLGYNQQRDAECEHGHPMFLMARASIHCKLLHPPRSRWAAR